MLGGLTAIESAFELLVVRLDCEPVRREANAARRGREALLASWSGVSPLAVALLDMRAASWFRVGRRTPLVLAGFLGGLDEGAGRDSGASVIVDQSRASGMLFVGDQIQIQSTTKSTKV